MQIWFSERDWLTQLVHWLVLQGESVRWSWINSEEEHNIIHVTSPDSKVGEGGLFIEGMWYTSGGVGGKEGGAVV